MGRGRGGRGKLVRTQSMSAWHCATLALPLPVCLAAIHAARLGGRCPQPFQDAHSRQRKQTASSTAPVLLSLPLVTWGHHHNGTHRHCCSKLSIWPLVQRSLRDKSQEKAPPHPPPHPLLSPPALARQPGNMHRPGCVAAGASGCGLVWTGDLTDSSMVRVKKWPGCMAPASPPCHICKVYTP